MPGVSDGSAVRWMLHKVSEDGPNVPMGTLGYNEIAQFCCACIVRGIHKCRIRWVSWVRDVVGLQHQSARGLKEV